MNFEIDGATRDLPGKQSGEHIRIKMCKQNLQPNNLKQHSVFTGGFEAFARQTTIWRDDIYSNKFSDP
jgi:hypothetical protein